jgi:plastocyanin
MLAIGAVAAALVAASVAPGGAQSTVHKVKVGDNFFRPDKLKVLVGDTVTFKWVGNAIHDVVSKKNPQNFKSKKQASGKYTQTFVEPGKYKIVCTLHPGMDMKLRVTEPPPPTTTTTAPPAA